MTTSNVGWENCDYLLWPAWYAYVSWGVLLAVSALGAYCIGAGL